MAACVTVWRGVTNFSAHRRGLKAGGSGVMRQSARIGNGCAPDVSKLIMVPMARKLTKVDGQRGPGMCVTSAPSNEEILSEEPSEDEESPFDSVTEKTQEIIYKTPATGGSVSESSLTANDNTDDEKNTFDDLTEKTQDLIDKTPGTEGSVSESSMTANDNIYDENTLDDVTEKTQERAQELIDKTPGTEGLVSNEDQETSESMADANASDLSSGLDYDAVITRVDMISKTSSTPESSSFGPLQPPNSRMMIEVINKLLKLLYDNLELVITGFEKCPQRELILAIIVILVWLLSRYVLDLSQIHDNVSFFV